MEFISVVQFNLLITFAVRILSGSKQVCQSGLLNRNAQKTRRGINTLWIGLYL